MGGVVGGLVLVTRLCVTRAGATSEAHACQHLHTHPRAHAHLHTHILRCHRVALSPPMGLSRDVLISEGRERVPLNSPQMSHQVHWEVSFGELKKKKKKPGCKSNFEAEGKCPAWGEALFPDLPVSQSCPYVTEQCQVRSPTSPSPHLRNGPSLPWVQGRLTMTAASMGPSHRSQVPGLCHQDWTLDTGHGSSRGLIC